MPLHIVAHPGDPLLAVIKDDPVRPEIPLSFRLSDSAQIFMLLDEVYARPQAVVCVAYRDTVPATVESLLFPNLDQPDTAVFYTIWSYAPGSGQPLIIAVRDWLRENRPEITRFVTLSPPTELARKFHLRNGALVLSVNSDSVNYEYK